MTAACAARRCERDPVHGLLCAEHGVRLADHYGAREGHGQPGRPVHGLPWCYDHLDLAYPSLTGWAGTGGKSGVDDAEAEKLSAVMTLRQEIHEHLAAVSADLAERLGRKGPPSAPSVRLAVNRNARWLLAHIEPLRAAQGIRATAEALAAAGDAASGTNIADDADVNGDGPAWAQPEAWALRQAAMAEVDGATACEAVASVLEEADDLASRCHALAPWREAPTRIDGIPCRCGSVGTIHDFGDIRRCARCGASYDDIHWAALTKVLAHRFRDEEGQTA